MNKFVTCLVLPFVLSGCSVMSTFPSQQVTRVDLGHNDFRLVQKNLEGSDRGFLLLGLIPFSTPSRVDAMAIS